MSEIEYKLTHKCGAAFYPAETIRLYANEDGVKKGYRYQDLMIGPCRCGEEVFAYIGVDDLFEPIRYEAISHKKHKEWAVRKESNRVVLVKQKLRAPGTFRPDDLGESKLKMNTVTGTQFDKNSGKWRFKENISVA